jgi:hypothetical protein
MKYSSIPKFIGTLLLVACCFASSSVFAHTPHARVAHGVIQSIDYQKQIMTLTYVQERGPQKLIWRSDTQFLCELKPVSVTELIKGAQVTIEYHSPFFGKPYATKVVWTNNQRRPEK